MSCPMRVFKRGAPLALAAGAAAVAAYVVWRRLKRSAGCGVRDVVLNTGARMPTVGLGTFQATKPGEVKAAVKAAVRAGYRLIDCAAGYGNQREIGDAIKELEAEGVCERADLFLVSKLFQTHHAGEQAGADGDSRCAATLDQTLAELQTEYLDLFLIHWPFGFGESKLEKPPGKKQPLRLKDGSPNPIWSIRMESSSGVSRARVEANSGRTGTSRRGARSRATRAPANAARSACQTSRRPRSST